MRFDESGDQYVLVIETSRVEMARTAVSQFGRDLSVTTRLDPPPFEFRDEDGEIRIAYWGQYASMILLGATQAEVTIEVADFMQGEVMEDLHAVWPECGSHGVGLHPELASDRASWICRTGNHALAEIGQL